MQNNAFAIRRPGVPGATRRCTAWQAEAPRSSRNPIGLGATWDVDLVHRVAGAFSTEARAKYHEAQHHDPIPEPPSLASRLPLQPRGPMKSPRHGASAGSSSNATSGLAAAELSLKRRWLYLLPAVFVTYSLAYLDRANYGFGAAAGLAATLHITGKRTSLLSALFFLGVC
jgi:hypothetical protein